MTTTTPCSTCIKANPIYSCAETWEVYQLPASVDGIELTYMVTNVATGYVWIGETETVQNDTATITLIDGLEELDGNYYKLELFEETNDGLVPVQISMGDSIGCCIEFTTFKGSKDDVKFNNVGCNG